MTAVASTMNNDALVFLLYKDSSQSLFMKEAASHLDEIESGYENTLPLSNRSD
jgi:hypothetical protein